MRSGIVAKKLGMTRIFTDSGEHVPVTVLQCRGCQVVAHRSEERDGYVALQVGIGKVKKKNLSKAVLGHFVKSGVEPKRKLVEFRVSSDALVEVGSIFSAAHFAVGQYVDVQGISIGRGFAGAMKRHNFGGLRASHGVSISHRSHGSVGGCQDPGKIFKNKKMAGHMGVSRVTVQNLKVMLTDVDRDLILLRGAVPGSRGGWVYLRDAVKRGLPDGVLHPGVFRNRPVSQAEPSQSSVSGGSADSLSEEGV